MRMNSEIDRMRRHSPELDAAAAAVTDRTTLELVGQATVRDAPAAALPAMRAVLRAVYGQYRDAMPAPVFAAYLANVLDLDRHTEGGQPLVAEVDGRVVGTAVYFADAASEGVGWTSGWAGVRLVGVHPAYRGRGIARRIMAATERRAREDGAAVLALHTAEFMTSALALYQHLGYRRNPEFDVDVTGYLGITEAEPLIALALTRDL